MESLRHQLLQAELTRIEQEAEAKSYAIMNKADALLAACLLCQQINSGLHVTDHFEVGIDYNGLSKDCRIHINTLDRGDLFLRRCDEIGLTWHDLYGALKVRFLRVDSVPSVEIAVDEVFIEMRAARAEALA